MRILYHHRTQADGAEGVHIAAMIEAFRDLGHDLFLLGAQPQTNARSPRGGSLLKAVLPAASFELLATLYNGPEYVLVRRVIRRFMPDLVYVRHARFGCAAPLAAAHSGVASVLEVNCLFADEQYHQFEPLTFRRLARRLELRALRAATRVVAVSTPLAARLHRLGVAPTTVLPNAANPVQFDPAAHDGWRIRERFATTDCLVVGWGGILRQWHGLDLLLAAVAGVRGVVLLVVGDGPARADVVARAASLGIGDRVHITGRVGHDEMPDYIAAMDIAVVADDRTRIASPMKLLEYMAMGRPVVAPDLPNIRDVVQPERDGLLFASGDGRAMADALTRLVGDRALRVRLGTEARAKINAERNWQANARAVLAAVQQRG